MVRLARVLALAGCLACGAEPSTYGAGVAAAGSSSQSAGSPIHDAVRSALDLGVRSSSPSLQRHLLAAYGGMLPEPLWLDQSGRPTPEAAAQPVAMARRVPVMLFYVTAAVMPGGESVHFAEDIYRHDAALDRAIATRRR